jgi:hypothetical protein
MLLFPAMLTLACAFLFALGGTSPTSAEAPPSQKDVVLRKLADLGAVVTVMSEMDQFKVLVDFRGGQLRREWRKEHNFPPPLCGMGVEFEIEPSDSGPPMTDSDLTLLDKVARLSSVDLTGTQVTAAGVAALRKRRPKLKVIWTEAPQ